MIIGKLYQIKKFFWYIYPVKEVIGRRMPSGEATKIENVVAVLADHWSKELNCNVSYISPNGIFCLLEQAGKYLKVLTTNGELGWIILPEDQVWVKGTIEELKET